MNTYDQLASLCLLAARTETLKKLIFSRPIDGDITRATGVLCRIGGKVVLQIETLHSDHKATHENLPLDRTTEDALALRFTRFSQINLLTVGGDCELRRTKKRCRGTAGCGQAPSPSFGFHPGYGGDRGQQ